MQSQKKTSDPAEKQALSSNRSLIRAGLVLSLGNLISRILGLGREIVKAQLFGTSPTLSAFRIATYVPMSLFQLIVGGEMVNSSLVPVFSDYITPDENGQRPQLWQVVSAFLSLATLALLVCVVLLMLFAPQVAALIGGDEFQDPTLKPLTIRLMRLATPAILFLSLASLMSGVLYALKRFTVPAFTAAILNTSFIICAIIWRNVEGLVWGLLIGSALQVVIQLPAMRDATLRWRPNWRHPAIRRIGLLYAPIIAGLVVNQISVGASLRLANQIGNRSLSIMDYATTLMQFPLGLVGTALAIAILPTLSEQASRNIAAFKATLAGGLRLVLGLILPATAGLFALAVPIIQLLFERNEFTPADTQIVALVLRVYLIGLPFAAIDQMLVFASYARKDTWRPALVGVISQIFYWTTALALLPSLGLLCLMVADAVKHFSHTAIMVWLLGRQTGGLSGQGILPTLGKALLGSVGTGIVAYGLGRAVIQIIQPTNTLGEAVVVIVAGAGGIAVYLAAVYLLDLQEIKSLLQRRKPTNT